MTDYERIRSEISLSDKRMKHTEGVIKAAEALAGRHFPFLSSEDVRVAALMHDFTKEYTLEQHREICLRWGIPMTPEDIEKPKLLHARTAAAIAEHTYGLNPEICSAVRWHTTGRPAMQPMEIVIYFADYIEENRVYPACVKLREFYEKQLGKRRDPSDALLRAVAKSFDITLQDLIENKELIDQTTVEARNYYRRLIAEGGLLT